jgi:predicted nucleotidyltransferase
MAAVMLSAYPPAVQTALSKLLAAIDVLELGSVAVVVFGSLAKGTYREGESDVNIALVLDEASPGALRGLTEPVRAAHHAVGMSPFVLERDEVPRLADVFPVKLADIAAHHHVLRGDDPFEGIAIDPEHLRLRVEQELRNQLLRLRRQAIFAGDDPRDRARAIYAAASSLAIELGALLDVAGVDRPEDPSPRAIFRRAAEAFDLDDATLDAIAEVKEGGALGDVAALFDDLLRLVGRAVAVADRLEPKP